MGPRSSKYSLYACVPSVSHCVLVNLYYKTSKQEECVLGGLSQMTLGLDSLYLEGRGSVHSVVEAMSYTQPAALPCESDFITVRLN